MEGTKGPIPLSLPLSNIPPTLPVQFRHHIPNATQKYSTFSWRGSRGPLHFPVTIINNQSKSPRRVLSKFTQSLSPDVLTRLFCRGMSAHLLWSLPSVSAYLLFCRGPGTIRNTICHIERSRDILLICDLNVTSIG